ncbi:MAG TPA: SRPBCC domain-containing protein [Thermoplasmata archaeon]|nr:SRPBCC domain-containing protein [Thermoplasmata archaeon]
MSGSPEAPAAPKPPPAPRSVLLGAAKITVRAPIPRVFEALTNGEQLAMWWAEDARIEAELGGRYEGTLPEGRVEGTITAIDGPGKLSYTWPVPHEGGSVETSVVFELSPKGPETAVHVAHRSPMPVPGGWDGVWQRSVQSLKAFLEQDAPGPA